MAGRHSRPVSGGRGHWETERLWTLARDLPVQQVPIDTIAEFDQNCWFRLHTPPTCRAVAAHARRIRDADLRHPIILAADGGLMDGGHRIAKAWILGHDTIAAVRFPETPAPDVIVSDDESPH